MCFTRYVKHPSTWWHNYQYFQSHQIYKSASLYRSVLLYLVSLRAPSIVVQASGLSDFGSVTSKRTCAREQNFKSASRVFCMMWDATLSSVLFSSFLFTYRFFLSSFLLIRITTWSSMFSQITSTNASHITSPLYPDRFWAQIPVDVYRSAILL